MSVSHSKIPRTQDPSSPLLQSTDAFKMYILSLYNASQASSIPAAAKKRDELLAAHGTIAAGAQAVGKLDTLQPTAGTENPTLTATPDKTQANTNSESQPNSSETIAQQVMASAQSTAKPTMESLKSPLTTNSSPAQTQPIQVSIVERKLKRVPINRYS